MAEKFKNNYRIKSTRLLKWDYGWNAAYFVTICTHNQRCFFGKIKNKIMYLSDVGIIADLYWMEIPLYFPYIKLGKHQVMPNHVHGILIIDKPIGWDETKNHNRLNDSNVINNNLIENDENGVNDPEHVDDPIDDFTIPKKTKGGITQNHNPMLHDNLSRVLRWYKGRVTYESHKISPAFKWQARFHDHIIRDEKAFQNITKYIEENPLNWNEDKFYGE